VTHFIKLKLKQAVQVTQAPALQQLLYGGQAPAPGQGLSETHILLLRMVRMRMANA
ncbi:hypothetical protein HaLaN_21724, partial [Haematococcus lacustris]